MTRKIISMLLCFAMLLSLVPFQVLAIDQTQGDFLQPVRQITHEDKIPTGYTPIYTEAELRAITNNPAGLYILMEDIELTRMEILCSNDAPFTGVLEGNGHTVSGIKISVSGSNASNYYWGLFSTVKDARIANLKVSGSLSLTIDERGKKNTCYIGGIAGLAEGNVNIVNCVNAVTIDHGPEDAFSSRGTGGIVGAYIGNNGANANFTSCRNMAAVSSVRYVGGIIGYCNLPDGTVQITGCRNNATISTEGAALIGCYTAGIVGYLTSGYYSQASIHACMNAAEVKGQLYSAGILAVNKGTSYSPPSINISSCANTGKVYAQEVCGGIIAEASGVVAVSDCINTGTVVSGTSQNDYAGIAASVESPVIRCINIGEVLSGSNNCAIACTVWTDDQTAEEMLSTCYWLEGSAHALYRYSDYSSGPGDNKTGMRTAEEMKKEATFIGYDFPAVWTMDEELGHPFPTALLDVTLENTYESTYIENTIAFADDSYRYVQILGGSGDGSLAGVVGDTYRKAGLDKVNGVWNAMKFVEGLANYTVEPITGYDVLLADLIGGSVSRNIREEHITTATLSMFSEIITVAGTGMDAMDILATEEYLSDMAELPSVFGDPAKKLLDTVRSTALKDVPFDDFADALGAVGGVVSVANATAAGCDSVDEVFDFYILCNAHASTVHTYGDVIRDSAVRAAAYDEKDGSKLIESANEFVDTMERNLHNDRTALYKASGSSMAGITGVAGCTIVEMALKVNTLNPFLSALDSVKTGFAVGMPVADALTNMDKIAYYGTLLDLCGTLSKGMFAEVQARRDTFAHSQTYEDAQALNVAATLYLNLQILACDYAIGYCNAIISGGFGFITPSDLDEIKAIVQVQTYKDKLLELQLNGKHIAIGADGSVNGFIAMCPVTVTVTNSSGNVISQMKSGDISVNEIYAGNFMLLGDSGEHKAGFFDPNEHTLTFTGEGSGTMDLIIYSSDRDGAIKVDCYRDVPMEEGTTYTLTPEGLLGDTLIKPSSTTESEPEPQSVPMFRMYDPNSGEHFYTGSTEERQFLVDAGWHYEGVGFNFPKEGAPIHRLYEPVTGEHLYTMDNAEKETLMASGWNYEGVAFNSADTDEVPQYRLHNPNASRGAYHFTGSEEERDLLISFGWEYQGIGWYSCLK